MSRRHQIGMVIIVLAYGDNNNDRKTPLSFTNFLLPAFANGYYESLSEEQLKTYLAVVLNSEEGTDVDNNGEESDADKLLKEMFGNSKT